MKAWPVHGLILARIAPGGDWQYGDVVRLRGHLQTPPDQRGLFLPGLPGAPGHSGLHAGCRSHPAALHRRQSRPAPGLCFQSAYAVDQVYRIFPEPEASLLAGILLGDDNGMPAELQQAYVNTGTAHIIAISGFNIAIIAGPVCAASSAACSGERKGAIAAVIGITVYTMLVGATASVVRAAIMGGLAIFARQVGRRQNGLNTLAFTGALMAVINPNVLWDVGFQLSFAATLGMILYAGPFQDWFTGLLARRLPSETARKVAGPVGAYVLFTLAAQLTTLPVMAYQFGRSFADCGGRQPLYPARPTGGGGPGRAGRPAQLYLPAAWKAGRLDGLAVRGLHQPCRGILQPFPARRHRTGRILFPVRRPVLHNSALDNICPRHVLNGPCASSWPFCYHRRPGRFRLPGLVGRLRRPGWTPASDLLRRRLR